MAHTHYLSDDRVHYKWDTANEPLITIDSGDTVVLENAGRQRRPGPSGR